MLGKLFQLVFGTWCIHKWVIICKGPIVDRKGVSRGNYYELQCEKCGDVKARNLTV